MRKDLILAVVLSSQGAVARGRREFRQGDRLEAQDKIIWGVTIKAELSA